MWIGERESDVINFPLQVSHAALEIQALHRRALDLEFGAVDFGVLVGYQVRLALENEGLEIIVVVVERGRVHA